MQNLSTVNNKNFYRTYLIFRTFATINGGYRPPCKFRNTIIKL